MGTVVKVKDLSKCYAIKHNDQSYATLVESLGAQALRMKEKAKRWVKGDFTRSSKTSESFWALKGVSFDIKEGDRVGIIGRNGAGKSTLLKLLSRISSPTTGTIKMKGRVSTLLEVGAGFHHELTGRENIYLNGSILGMRHSEIKTKFDEIVAFSGVETFLDTPIKRYSSGMFARLGFAIAAHLHSDIMIIDEVLAVGDAQFQKKCLEKLDELGRVGRTVLFVSHSISSVLSLCTKGIYLEKGNLKLVGTMEQCANAYTNDFEGQKAVWADGYGDQTLYFNRVQILPPDGNRDFFLRGESVIIEFDLTGLTLNPNLYIGIKLYDGCDQFLGQSFFHDEHGDRPLMLEVGSFKVRYALNTSNLYEGDYFIKVECGLLHDRHIVHGTLVLKFSVIDDGKVTRFSEFLSKGTVYIGDGWKRN